LDDTSAVDQSTIYPSTISLRINGHMCSMEVDTGAINTIMGVADWYKIGFPTIRLLKLRLKCYSGLMLKIKGECVVNVRHNNRSINLPIVVVNSSSPSLLGLYWISQLKLDLNHVIHGSNYIQNGVHRIHDDSNLQKVLQKHQKVLNDGLGYCNKVQADIQLKPHARPKFFKPRSLPSAHLDGVKGKIQRNVKADILPRIDTSAWASPIVPVKKPNGKIRTEFDLRKPTEVSEPIRNTKYNVGQLVWYLKHKLNKRPQWQAAIIIKQIGSMLYEVQSADGKRHKHHQNQLRPRFSSKTQSSDVESLSDELLKKNSQSEPAKSEAEALPRYPRRNRRPPDRF